MTTPSTSVESLSFTNGFAAGSYNLSLKKVDTLRDHVYKVVTPQPNEWLSKDFCYDIYFGWRCAGKSGWLTDAPIVEAGYVDGTGIVKVVQRAGSLRFETFYFSPFSAPDGQTMVAICRAVNEGADAADCSVFSLQNLRLGGDDDMKDEWAYYDPSGNYTMEGKTGTGYRAVYAPIGAFPSHAAFSTPGPGSPWETVKANGHLHDPTGAVNGDDVACAFEWQIADGRTFPSGNQTWAGFVVALGSNGDEAGLKKLAQDVIGGKSCEEVIAREVGWWQKWHSTESPPAGLSAAQLAVYRQSLAVLKMSQCREQWAAQGQIVASLPPGQWNICWPRDMSYSIAALARTGHLDEAKLGLQFLLNGKADKYRNLVGKKYRISICRYFGDGEEESDDDGNGPNLEFDNFGLFLWALAEYVERSHDTKFLSSAYPTARDEVADVLVSLIDTHDLLKPDSSIWERHLNAAQNTPDGRKQYAYSAINAANGLARMSKLAMLAGDPAKASEWADASSRLRDSIAKNLTMSDGSIAASWEQLNNGGVDWCADGSVVEAFNFGLFDPTGPTATSTLGFLDRELRAWPTRSPGFLRCVDGRHYSNGNWYDMQEWVMIDLRTASAYAKAGRADDAKLLIDWVTVNAAANGNLIPELLDANTSSYQGAVPMVGFGAGAYVLACEDTFR